MKKSITSAASWVQIDNRHYYVRVTEFEAEDSTIKDEIMLLATVYRQEDGFHVRYTQPNRHEYHGLMAIHWVKEYVVQQLTQIAP